MARSASQGARKNPLLIPFICLAVLVAIVAAGMWAVSGVLEGQTRRLADGSVLQLEAVSYERQHLLVDRGWRQKLLGPVLRHSFPSNAEYSFDSDTDELAFLLFQRTIPGSKGWKGCAVVSVDEHGCRVGRGTAMTVPALASGSLSTRTPIYGALDAFPRRAGTFRLRVYPENSISPAAEFRVINPKPGPYPTWRPDPLPMTRRQGALQVTLSPLTTDLSWPDLLQSQPPLSSSELQKYGAYMARYPLWSRMLPAPWQVGWTRASFRILDHGRPSRDWRLEGVTVADATGNALPYRAQDPRTCLRSGSDPAGHLWFAFHKGLCARESAWKLRAFLPWVGPADPRRADLRWTMHQVPVPLPGETIPLDATMTRQAVTLRVRGVSGSNTRSSDQFRTPVKTIRVHAEVRRPAGLRLRLLTCATDEQGRELGLPSNSVFDGRYEWQPTLQIPSGVKTLTLTFAVWKERIFEFLVRPAS